MAGSLLLRLGRRAAQQPVDLGSRDEHAPAESDRTNLASGDAIPDVTSAYAERDGRIRHGVGEGDR
jgi:hypothetical protein